MTNPSPAQSRHDAETALLRYAGTLLCLHVFCPLRACRRARRCKGEPRDCVPRYTPLVPEDARAGVEAMLEGRDLGLSFEELREEAPDEMNAAILWIGKSHASGQPRARRRRAPLRRAGAALG